MGYLGYSSCMAESVLTSSVLITYSIFRLSGIADNGHDVLSTANRYLDGGVGVELGIAAGIVLQFTTSRDDVHGNAVYVRSDICLIIALDVNIGKSGRIQVLEVPCGSDRIGGLATWLFTTLSLRGEGDLIPAEHGIAYNISITRNRICSIGDVTLQLDVSSRHFNTCSTQFRSFVALGFGRLAIDIKVSVGAVFSCIGEIHIDSSCYRGLELDDITLCISTTSWELHTFHLDGFGIAKGIYEVDAVVKVSKQELFRLCRIRSISQLNSFREFTPVPCGSLANSRLGISCSAALISDSHGSSQITHFCCNVSRSLGHVGSRGIGN